MTKRIRLYRYIQSAEAHTKKLKYTFVDEHGKITIVKYILKKMMYSNINNLVNYIWRLDGRSIRYMKRVMVIENKKEGI